MCTTMRASVAGHRTLSWMTGSVPAIRMTRTEDLTAVIERPSWAWVTAATVSPPRQPSTAALAPVIQAGAADPFRSGPSAGTDSVLEGGRVWPHRRPDGHPVVPVEVAMPNTSGG